MGGFFRVVINSKMLLILTYFSDFISCQNTFSSYFVKNNWAFFEFVTTLEPSKKEFLSLFFASSRSPETRAKSQTHLLYCKTEQHPFWGQHFQGLQKSYYSSSSVLFGLTAAMTLRPDNNLCCCSNPFKAIAEAKRKRKTNLEPVTRNFHFQLELAIFLSSPTHRHNYEGLQWACHESQDREEEGLQTHHPQEGVSGKRRWGGHDSFSRLFLKCGQSELHELWTWS